MSRLCPDCRKPLRDLTYSGLHLGACHDCGGIWFDTGGLRSLVHLGPNALAVVEGEAKPHHRGTLVRAAVRLCPNCDTPLHLCHYGHASSVDLDTCDACRGAWVEEGELDRIRLWLASCALEPMAAQPRLAPAALVA